MKLYTLCIASAVGLAVGCADELVHDAAPDAGAEPDTPDAAPTARITHTDNGDGTTTSVVDATDADTWISLVLATATEADPTASPAWDLGFQRSNIRLNGGASGPGEVTLTWTEAAFDDLTVAPDPPYLTDGAGDDGAPVYAFDWYDYDPLTHVLTPRARTYVVRSNTGDYYKIAVLDYYDDAGTSGFLTFRWASVMAPAAERR